MASLETIREIAKIAKKMQILVETELGGIKREEPELEKAYKHSKVVSSSIEDFIRRTE